MGQSKNMRISVSTERSAIRRSRHLIKASWGIVSKYEFQIRVVDLTKLGGEVLADRVDRLMSVPARTEPVGAVQEVGLKDRLEHQQNRHLNDPVFDRRDAHSALPPYPNRLRDSSPSPIRIIRSAASKSRSSGFAAETIPISSSDSPTGGMPPSP